MLGVGTKNVAGRKALRIALAAKITAPKRWRRPPKFWASPIKVFA